MKLIMKGDTIMKKIAIFNCLKANEMCTGAACMNALNHRKAGFEVYKDEEVELLAFMRCNGCSKEPGENEGMREKLERIVSLSPDALHIGKCTIKGDEECSKITKAAEILESKGVRIIRGTH